MKNKTKKTTKKPAEPDLTTSIRKTFMNLERIKGMLGHDADRLTIHDRMEIMLDRARKNQDAGLADEAACFFFKTIALDRLSEERIMKDAELARISADIEKQEKEYGLKEDEDWPAGEAPENVEALRAVYNERCHQITIDVMREHGEDEIADLFQDNEKEYYSRRLHGTFLLLKDDEETKKDLKQKLQETFIKLGWEDILPGLDM